MKHSHSKRASIWGSILVVAVLAIVLVTAGCSATDVIGKVSVTSFDNVLSAVGDKVTTDEMNNGWSLQSPGGERFVWSKDFGSAGKPDLMMEINAQPFLDAGVDAAAIKEWIFAKVEVKDASGKKELVDKFLKPYNLK